MNSVISVLGLFFPPQYGILENGTIISMLVLFSYLKLSIVLLEEDNDVIFFYFMYFPMLTETFA